MIRTTQRLPQEYQEVEYVQSDGNAYIDTGYDFTGPTGYNEGVVEYIAETSSNSDESVYSFFGSSSGGGSLWGAIKNNSGAVRISAGFNSYYSLQIDVTSNEPVKVKFISNRQNGDIISCNGASKNTSSKALSWVTKPARLYLFSRGTSQISSHTKLSRLTFSINGDVILDYIPCYRKSDNVIGMYDLVNNTFYTNAGTGTFTAGPEVTTREVGFIHTKHNESMVNIDKIMTKSGGNMVQVFEQGFTREQEATTFPVTLNHQTVGKNLKQYQIYGDSKQDSLLPDGYTQLSYIENAGAGYIDSGITSGQVDETIVKVAITDTSKNQQYFLGTRSGNTAIGYALYFPGHGGLNYYPLSWPISSSGYTPTQGTIYEIQSTFKDGDSSFSIKDTYSQTRSYTQSTYDSGNNIFIGAIRELDGSSGYLSYARYYRVTFKKDDALVADYIPAMRNSDSKVGLYDLVSKTFLFSPVTAQFTAGSGHVTPDNPVEIISVGDKTKNLFDVEYYKTLGGWTTSGLYQYKPINLEAGKTYTISSNTINNPAISALRIGRFVDGSYSSIFQLTSNSSGASTIGKREKSFVSQGNEIFYAYTPGWFTVNKLKTLFEEDVIDIQVEEGTTIATAYEPYGYKIPVEISSKNLFSANNSTVVKNDYIDSDGSISHYSGSSYNSAYVSVKPNTQYTLSGLNGVEASVNFAICHYTEDKTFISRTNRHKLPQTVDTFTTASNEYFIRANGINDTDYTLYQLEEGSTATDYEPYFNQTTNIYLDEPLRKIGNYADYVDFKAGKVVRNVVSKPFLATDNWEMHSGASNTLRLDGLSNVMQGVSVYSPICSHFSQVNKAATADFLTGEMRFQSTNDLITGTRIYVCGGMSVASWTTWLGSNRPELLYIAATPTEQTVTLPAIPTPKGTATIDFDTTLEPSKIKITYKGK